MLSKEMIVNITADPEERPVAMLVQIASQFDSSIYLLTEDKHINAKSIMGMMSLGLKKGEKNSVKEEGNDEEQAVSDLEKYLCSL